MNDYDKTVIATFLIVLFVVTYVLWAVGVSLVSTVPLPLG